MEQQASSEWGLNILGPGTHVCFLYETEDQLRAVLTSFIREGLEKNEKVICIEDAAHSETPLEGLCSEIPNMRAGLETGQVTLLRADETYLRSGVFDPDEMIALLNGYTEGALADGYAGLRVTGEMTWALRDLPGADRLLEYEARLNDFFPGSRCLALCQYPVTRFPAPLLLDALRTHPQVMIGTEVYDNPHYVPPSILLGTDRSSLDLRRWMAEMGHRKTSDAALQASEAYFREITENASDMTLIVNKEGILTYVSPSVERFMGYRPEELIGKAVFDFIHPADLQRAMTDFAGALQAQETAIPNSFRVFHKDGSERVLEGLGKNLLNHPAIAGFIMNVQDVTDRVSAEWAAREAHEALQLAAKNWQTTFDAMLDPVVLLAPDGTIRQCNQAFAEFVGLEADAAAGQKCFHLVHRTKGHVEGCPLLRSLQSADREIMPMSVGDEEFLVVTDPIQGPDAQISGLVHVMRDVTELKRAYRVLEESEDRYRDLVENSRDLICTHDLEGCILSLNPWPAHLLGYDRYTLVGMNLRDLLAPENAPAFDEYLKTVRTEGAAKGIMIVQTRSGQRRVWEYNNTLRTEGVETPIVRGMARDITERKQAEERIRESEETYRNIFQNAQVGLYRTRISDGKILESNEQLARMFGYDTREEFIAEYVTSQNYVDPGTRERMLDEIQKNGGVKDFEVRFYRKDRSIFWARYSARIYSEKGWIEGVAEDITERKQAEEEKDKLHAQLMQAQKMESVGRLAGGVAHDFNNKLSIILGYLQMAMGGVAKEDPVYEDLQEVLRAANQSAEIVRQLMAFARKQVIEPKTTCLNDTVESMLKMLRRLIGEEIELGWKPGANLWPVYIDPAQIDQILANLCVNARDSISGVGKVTIETENVTLDERYCANRGGVAPGEYMMLGVSDNGCGMDREILESIFEPFFTTKELGKGTGLGLATVYGIVKQNQGYIDVVSEPGRGACFRIYLPRHHGAAEKEVETSEPSLLRGSGETILVVEDDASLLGLTQVVLSQAEYHVLAAANPMEAMEMFRQHEKEIDLLLADVVLPKMSGVELATEIKKIRPNIKTLFMSGYAKTAELNHEPRKNAVPFLDKPFTPDRLTRTVREALGN
jgi:PAS domain S-box-containing protein